jgi:predicted transcriptional regulator
MKYYIGSLLGKECIMLSEIVNGYKRYQITEKGIKVINDINESYDISMRKFIDSNSIVV